MKCSKCNLESVDIMRFECEESVKGHGYEENVCEMDQSRNGDAKCKKIEIKSEERKSWGGGERTSCDTSGFCALVFLFCWCLSMLVVAVKTLNHNE